MTLFVDFRSSAVGGRVIDPRVVKADDTNAGQMINVPETALATLAAGRDVLLATHGFNVSRVEGIRSLARLERQLNPSTTELLLGILWPGDFWLPVLNYPMEAEDAVECGRGLAEFCHRHLRAVRSLSFLSHSLGARLILEAVANLRHPLRARSVCLTAAAVDWDCLDGQYTEVLDRAEVVSTLSSHRDWVLRIAYPVGDLVSDLFLGDSDDPFTRALGLLGPKPAAPAGVLPFQVGATANYGHGDYLPPSSPEQPPDGRWNTAVDFMIRCFRGQPQSWP
jgi:esterase/lipase superfamily enzyme